MHFKKLTIMGALVTGMLPFMSFSAGARSVAARNAGPKQTAKAPEQKYYTTIQTMDEYEQACKAQSPTVIVYSSSTCAACDAMEPGFNECAKTYYKGRFYWVDAEEKKFAGVHKKVKIEAYPTTHFLRKGKEPRVERGSIGAQELDGITYEFINGKRKPLEKPAPKAEEMKKSLQEKTR